MLEAILTTTINCSEFGIFQKFWIWLKSNMCNSYNVVQGQDVKNIVK